MANRGRSLSVDPCERGVQKSTMDPEGDLNLRRSYHNKLKSMLRLPGGAPKDIVDIGCAVGLSTFSLLEVGHGWQGNGIFMIHEGSLHSGQD